MPFRRVFATSAGGRRYRQGVLLQLYTADGAVGLGEASPLSLRSDLAAYTAEVAALVRGVFGLRVNDAWALRLGAQAEVDELSRAAAAALETALAGLASASADIPLWRFLAVPPEPPPAPVPVNAVIDAIEPALAAADAHARMAEGYTVLKVKVGAGDDLARLREVRAAAGLAATLRVDANGTWPDIETALDNLQRLAAYDLVLCEEPLADASSRRAELAELARLSPVPLAVDESCRTQAELAEVIAAGGVQVVVLKPSLTGLVEARRMAVDARSAGMGVSVTTALDAGVASAAALHFAASLPSPRIPAGLATLGLLDHPLVHGFPEVLGGVLSPPEIPGLGVTLDIPSIQRHASSEAIEVKA